MEYESLMLCTIQALKNRAITFRSFLSELGNSTKCRWVRSSLIGVLVIFPFLILMMSIKEIMNIVLDGLRSYWEAVVLSVVIVIISLILQIPYADDEADDPG